jgi:hypothetical protein
VFYDLAHYINGQGSSWTSGPELYSYNSYDFITTVASNADAHFQSDHPEGHYVGVGYSEGGLLTRSIEYNHGMYNPVSQHYMEGLVTLGTPNAGADLDGRWEGWLARQVSADVEIGRADNSFLSDIGYLNYVIGVPFTIAIGEAVRALWPQMIDMTPGSSFMNSINAPVVQSITTSLPRGWCAVYGTVNTPRLPSYDAADDEPDIITAQNNWNGYIVTCRNNSHNWDSRANDAAGGGWWHRLTHKIDCIWSRMRAGDWNATANGWNDLNTSWEWATGGVSDGFMSNASAINQAPHNLPVAGQMNHGGLAASTPGATSSMECNDNLSSSSLKCKECSILHYLASSCLWQGGVAGIIPRP